MVYTFIVLPAEVAYIDEDDPLLSKVILSFTSLMNGYPGKTGNLQRLFGSPNMFPGKHINDAIM